MWEAEREEFALEALATSDSWDAGAGRVFTFPPLSAHRHQWGPLPAEQVLGGGSREHCTLLCGWGPLWGQGCGIGQPESQTQTDLVFVWDMPAGRFSEHTPDLLLHPHLSSQDSGAQVTQSHPSGSCLLGFTWQSPFVSCI